MLGYPGGQNTSSTVEQVKWGPGLLMSTGFGWHPAFRHAASHFQEPEFQKCQYTDDGKCGPKN